MPKRLTDEDLANMEQFAAFMDGNGSGTTGEAQLTGNIRLLVREIRTLQTERSADAERLQLLREIAQTWEHSTTIAPRCSFASVLTDVLEGLMPAEEIRAALRGRETSGERSR